jgi:hypothetical protein
MFWSILVGSSQVHIDRLYALMKEADWNGQTLAEAINLVGRDTH